MQEEEGEDLPALEETVDEGSRMEEVCIFSFHAEHVSRPTFTWAVRTIALGTC